MYFYILIKNYFFNLELFCGNKIKGTTPKKFIIYNYNLKLIKLLIHNSFEGQLNDPMNQKIIWLSVGFKNSVQVRFKKIGVNQNKQS